MLAGLTKLEQFHLKFFFFFPKLLIFHKSSCFHTKIQLFLFTVCYELRANQLLTVFPDHTDKQVDEYNKRVY